VNRYRLGPASPGVAAKDYSRDKAPLKTLIERESIVPAAGKNVRVSAQMGQHFSRLLNLAGLAKYTGAFLTSFPLQPPAPAARASPDSDTLNYLAVMAQRVIDGPALYSKLAPGRPPGGQVVLPVDAPFNALAAADRPAMINAATDWMNWYENLFSQPQPNETAWSGERMEYTFAISGNTSRGEMTLSAPEYRDGTLDWYSYGRHDRNSGIRRKTAVAWLSPSRRAAKSLLRRLKAGQKL
jgi:hypothetical protein